MASKLQKSIHNQLDVVTPLRRCSRSAGEEASLQSSVLVPANGGGDRPSSKQLTLRNENLVLLLPAVLAQCSLHFHLITSLDISYSIVDSKVLNTLCERMVYLQVLCAKSCGLCETIDVCLWSRKMQELDLSRNKLTDCPRNILRLIHLHTLNLSGNKIHFLAPDVLRLPSLSVCRLLNNPIENIPKDVCREGVGRMREFLDVQPLPAPQDEVNEEGSGPHLSGRRRTRTSGSVSSCLRRFVLHHQGSFESGYESSHYRRHSSSNTSSTSTDTEELSESSDTECNPDSVNDITSPWSTFCSQELPEGYTAREDNDLCQVYLPDDYSAVEVRVHMIKDMSLHPQLRDNELLVTPVVRITPHGLAFGSKPAIIALSHCTKPHPLQVINFIPLCSSTGEYEHTKWTPIGDNTGCKVFKDHIVFSTFHFSLFAVAASFPYPSSSIEVSPNIGGELLIPELPGFRLHIPDHCVGAPVTLRGTAYYCDESYRASSEYALASACIALEPHGMRFASPVQVSIPIPDYCHIKSEYPEATLELWHAQELGDGNWELVKCDEGTQVQLESNIEDRDCQVAIFKLSHFSWYEFLWNVCASSLQRLNLGAASVYRQLASRARFVSVRFQVFMSPPHGVLHTFGLVITVYKFGDPLSPPGNYPLLVADSGSKRVFLRIGPLHVRLEGCFSANQDLSENLEREGRVMDFTGEDFCERFEFCLNLKSGVAVPLQEGQVLGKFHFIQWEHSSPIHKSFNLIMVSN